MRVSGNFDLSLKSDKFGMSLYNCLRDYGDVESLDMDAVQTAFSMSKFHHGEQKRKSGEPFYSHPVEVASLICKFKYSTDLVCAALLHDTVEDTSSNINLINFAINRQVGIIVDAVTNLNVNKYVKLSSFINTQKIHQIEDAVLLKLCDRLHNTRTMGHLKPHKVEKKVKENLVTFIPAAKSRKYEELAQELTKASNKLIQDLGLFNKI